jgi:hypothetical protein
MTLRELREVYSPNENVKIVYRDPRDSLNYSCLYEGLFKWCRDPRLWERRVVIISTNFFETQTVIEVE